MGDGHEGAPDEGAGEGFGALDLEAGEVAPVAGVEVCQEGLGLQGYGVGDEAATGFEVGPGLVEEGLGEAAAEEDGVGWLVGREGLGGFAFGDREVWDAQFLGVAGYALGAV